MPHILDYFSSLGPHQWIGLAGFICYISAFGSVQLGLMDGNSLAYSLANILAASMVAISLISDFNLASALIQGSWIVFGVVGLFLRMRRSWPTARRALNTTLEVEVK